MSQETSPPYMLVTVHDHPFPISLQPRPISSLPADTSRAQWAPRAQVKVVNIETSPAHAENRMEYKPLLIIHHTEFHYLP